MNLVDRRVSIDPTVADRLEAKRPAARLDDIKGKRIGFVDNSKLNADIFLTRLRGDLAERFGAEPGPVVRKAAPKDKLTDRDYGTLSACDGIIQVYGDCGTSTSISVADAVELESRGLPTVTVFSTAFAAAARNQACGRGMPDFHLVVVPHPMHTAPRDIVESRAADSVDDLVAGLTRAADLPGRGENLAPDLASLAEANVVDDQELLYARGWSDGLPLAIPTAEKVDEMIALSGRDPREEIGPIPPRMRRATIEKIAINAVLAGCRPDYFPVVLAALEAALEDNCQLYSIQTATNTTAPLFIVNGPVVDRLEINARANVFGQGWRANATIGRAVQLILRNVGGDMPGQTDMSSHGQAGKFTACIGEAEADSPWDAFHVEAGFRAEDSTVTVLGASGPQNVFTYGCENGAEILDHLIGAMTGLGHNNIIFPSGPLLVLNPEHASVLARDGFGKSEIRQAVFERARIPLSRFAHRTVAGLHHRRMRWFATVGDVDHIGVADRPEDVHIVVAGGPGIHSLFVPTGFSFRPVTRLVPQP